MSVISEPTGIPDTILTMPHIDDWSIVEDDDDLDATSSSCSPSDIFRPSGSGPPTNAGARASQYSLQDRSTIRMQPIPFYAAAYPGYPPYPMMYPPHMMPPGAAAYPMMPHMMYHPHPAAPLPHVVHPSPPRASSSSSSQVEAAGSSYNFKVPDLIQDVSNRDVLCGRGAPTNHHEGNVHFRQVVARFQSQYLAARRSDKPEIAMKVLDIIRKEGGRFLRRNKHHVNLNGSFAWEELPEQRAYEKACQALRDVSDEEHRRIVAASEGLASVSMDYTE